MRVEHLRYLACPKCKSALWLAAAGAETAGRVRTGTLSCPRCARSFEVREFIPRFVSAQNYAEGFGLEWTKHARTQLDSFTAVSVSERRFFEATQWPRHLEGETILEVGSGAGRFTEVAARTGATIVSLEYSEAVDANYASNGWKENVFLVHGDLYEMPFPENSFDRVFCFGVLQHTPDVERAFLQLPRYLKPGGRLAVDVYRKLNGWRRLVVTKYWVRPLTSRLPPALLYQLVRAYVNFIWPVSRLINRIPNLGSKINWLLLVVDYGALYGVPKHLRKDWVELDIFDVLSPRYDLPQSTETVEGWFREAGLIETELCCRRNLIEARGIKPFVQPGNS